MELDGPTSGGAAADAAPQGLAVEVRRLSKSFGRTPVLRKLDLEVPWGEGMTILGPNGSGKTTLVKVLATLTRPDEGEVRVGGLDVARSGQRTRRIAGVVTHDPLMYDELTGYENLRFVCRMFGLDRADDRISSVAEQLAITPRLHQRAGTLSHGMRKRLSIARALLHDPLVLLMDEPDSGLDQEALAMLDAILSDPSRPFRTVLMTTHNLERGLALGRRLAILGNGGIAYQGPIDSSSTADSVREAYFRHTGAPL